MTRLPQGSFLRNKRYRIDGFLGQGGFGITYQAHDTLFDKAVAIKEYYPKDWVTRPYTTITANSPYQHPYKNFLKKFIKEGQALSHFQEIPAIVSIRDIITNENGTAYLIMDLIEGTTLTQTILQAGGTLSHDTALYYTREIGNALTTIHNAGIIHRDISPDNVMITPQNKIVLIDFGSARTYAEHTSKLTSVFKLFYAPPEQISPDPSRHGPPTDIYALAATLYAMLTGIPPTSSIERTTATTLERPDPLVPPSKIKPDIPPQTEDAILAALQLTPRNRPPTVAAFLDLLPHTKNLIPNRHTKNLIPAKNPAFTCPTPSDLPPIPRRPKPTPTNIKQHRKLPTPRIFLFSTLTLFAFIAFITLIAVTMNNTSTNNNPNNTLITSNNSNTTTINLLHTLHHKNSVRTAVFSPDATLAITASDDDTAKIWDTKTGKHLHTLHHRHQVRTAAFSPDATLAITASWDNTAKIWNTKTGKHLHTLHHDDWVRSAVFSPNTTLAITTSDDDTAKIWDTKTGKHLHTLHHNSYVWSAAFSPDATLAITTSRHTAKIWNTKTGKHLHTLQHNNEVRDAVFNLDGTHIITASRDHTAKIWKIS